MSLNDILKTIKSEAEKEAEEIKRQGEEEVKKIEAEIFEQTKKEQEKILARFRGEMEKKVKQAKFIKESATKTLRLKKKREILDKVYEGVIEKIVGDNDIYDNVIKKAAEQLPKVSDDEIALASNNPDRTKRALGASRLKHKMSDETVDARGGFVLRSDTLEIDNTVEALVREVRGETEIEVGRVLFNE